MNKMKVKRDLLKDFLLGVLQAHDPDYRLEDRLRMATFEQTSRAERIEIMGANFAYGEVLYRPATTPEGKRSARSTSRGRNHTFDVFIWYKFKDADTYENSSQSFWDDLVEADNGVLKSIENQPQLDNYTLSKPTDLSAHEVVMDSNPLELAHFLNFKIEVKG